VAQGGAACLVSGDGWGIEVRQCAGLLADVSFLFAAVAVLRRQEDVDDLAFAFTERCGRSVSGDWTAAASRLF